MPSDPGIEDDYFEGKIAIVTGGASGIGRAISTALIDRGTTVVLSDISAVGSRLVAAEIDGTGKRALAATLDVTDADAVARLVERTASKYGRLDFMFNNAGIGVGGPVEDLTLSDWRQVIDVDLFSVIYGVAAAYPIMVRQGFGHIVNTASLEGGLIPARFLTPYATAKHAVVGLSVNLRLEAATHGVRVSALCPGPTDTPLLDSPGPVKTHSINTKALGEAYPAADLAADVLEGIVENQVVIVAPQSARNAWRSFLQTSDEFLTTIEDGSDIEDPAPLPG